MSVQDEIYEWVKGFELWKQELFICASAGPELAEEDLEAVTAMLLGESVEGREPRKVSREDLPAAEGAKDPMVIRRICDLQNVNAIAADQTLHFAEQGLNVVWGANGAGKTGYSRVLKHAGRTLHREEVLTNVDSDGPASAPSARLFVAIGKEEKEELLDLTANPPGYLARVCIADAKAGETYLTDETEVDYVPTTLRGLSRLAAALTAVQDELRARRQRVVVPEVDARAFGECTAVAKLLAELDANTTEDKIEALAGLNEEEKQRRGRLREELGEIEAKQAPALRMAAERDAADASRLRSDLSSLAQPFEAATLAQVRERETALAETREAASLIAEDFSAQPLSGVGSEPWRALWNAARAYAAHIDQQLPPDHDSARCPLCMQELGAEGRDRLAAFDRFVADDVNARLRRLEDEREQWLLRLPDVEAIRRTHQGVIDRLGVEDGELGAEVLDWLDRASESLERLRAAEIEGLEQVALPDGLESWIEARSEEAAHHAAIESGEETKRIRRDLAELDARALLGERKEELLARLRALRQRDRLEQAIAEADRRAVSRKIGVFSQDLIRAGLEKALNQQLKELEFRGLEVIPKLRTVEGRPMVSLKFKTVDGVRLTSVLSHGEQRRLALAMFLAEMEVLDDPSPIVFDDPTSSVDQEGRRRIAATLRRLAADRQVIVFTHELSLVYELERGEPLGLPLKVQHVHRKGDTVGHVRPSVPWEGLSPSDRIGPLTDRLDTLKRIYRERDGESYSDAASIFCERLREAFERAVEERVLAGVVRRRDDDVQTKKLREVHTAEEICAIVDFGMSERSAWVHDKARADGASPPAPDELRKGLDLYKELLDKLSEADTERRKDKKQRKQSGVSKLKLADSGRGEDTAAQGLSAVPTESSR